MISGIRGFKDILPGEIDDWQRVERTARELFKQYGYQELRTPLLEKEELFTKGTGETTDIVQKEMYSFTDKGGERVTLRPEATPSMVRAYVEHSLDRSLGHPRVYCMGPMFRYERPQKGRFRQFSQIDVEVFGYSEPEIDAEVVEMAWQLVKAVHVEGASLYLNSIGDAACRPKYLDALRAALAKDVEKLCEDCQRRSITNPLRVFDCKMPEDQPILDKLPRSLDFLCDPCATHFQSVTSLLKIVQVPFVLSHRLVRGLDYYTRTVFEIQGETLGAQNAILGGGRYDGLVKDLGGPDKPGIGFAAGLERLVLASTGGVMRAPRPIEPDYFIAAQGDEARRRAFDLQRQLRLMGFSVQMAYGVSNLLNQIKRGERLGARQIITIAADEVDGGYVSVKEKGSKEARRSLAVLPVSDGDNFSLIALALGGVEKDAEPAISFTIAETDVVVAPRIAMAMGNVWERWLGTIRAKELHEADLFIVSKSERETPEVGGQSVARAFYFALLLNQVGFNDQGFELGGHRNAGTLDVKSVTILDATRAPFGHRAPRVDRALLTSTAETTSGIKFIYNGVDGQFQQIRRAFWGYQNSLKLDSAEERMSLCLEALFRACAVSPQEAEHMIERLYGIIEAPPQLTSVLLQAVQAKNRVRDSRLFPEVPGVDVARHVAWLGRVAEATTAACLRGLLKSEGLRLFQTDVGQAEFWSSPWRRPQVKESIDIDADLLNQLSKVSVLKDRA